MDNTNYSEYIQGTLSTTLTPGANYCVSFYISNADSSLYFSNDIGFYLSSTSVFENTNQSLTLTASGSNSFTNVNDKTSWKLISLNYTATGGEKYLIIGNFKSPAQTSSTVTSGATWMNGVYFYVDDVSIYAGPCTSSIKNNPSSEYKLYPTLITGDKFYIEGFYLKGDEIKCYSSYGIEYPLQVVLDNKGTVCDVSDLPEGIYYVELKIQGIYQPKKIIKR